MAETQLSLSPVTTISSPPITLSSSAASSFNGTASASASNGTVISFPSITASSTMNFTSLSTSSLPPTSTPSVNSQFSAFVTQSSLFLAPTSSSSASTTLTDPDAATTFNLTIPTTTAAADSKPTQAPLPSNLPSVIFPAEGSHPGDPDLTGYTLISILFDSALSWSFVTGNSGSPSQIFAWMPLIIQTALGLQSNQVKTYELKVNVPSTYTGPADVALLQTMYLGWIPNDSVDDLAQQLKVTSSAFYHALGDPYSQLAAHVVSSFPVTNAGTTGTDDGTSGTSPSSASSSSNTREDAIIGVVSSLGAIALLILAFLVFRAVKQRRALAHRRLSDPPNEFIGAPPEDHEFDRDSVGGQRRRSFYYAADSISVQPPPAPPQSAYADDPFNPTMRERRPPIGAPILRDNTMNW
ncbi:hypothetical protein C2E23DRAFT_872378 [Lenzites betulinus]|nr:hypothetical protein C2E23DRAFT_872378 [Lenzites betulinus]